MNIQPEREIPDKRSWRRKRGKWSLVNSERRTPLESECVAPTCVYAVSVARSHLIDSDGFRSANMRLLIKSYAEFSSRQGDIYQRIRMEEDQYVMEKDKRAVKLRHWICLFT